MDNQKDETWGYTSKREKITDTMMLKIIKEADRARMKNTSLSQRETEKQSENW